MFKKYKHNPPHYFQDHSIYFVTSGTYQKKHLLNTPDKKQILLDYLLYFSREYNHKLLAWVILENHYHLLMDVPESDAIPAYFRKIHSCSGRNINQLDRTNGRKVWWNYWDTWIESEKRYVNTLSYIFWNPVKHGYAGSPVDYEFSNYGEFINDKTPIESFDGDLLKEDNF